MQNHTCAMSPNALPSSTSYRQTFLGRWRFLPSHWPTFIDTLRSPLYRPPSYSAGLGSYLIQHLSAYSCPNFLLIRDNTARLVTLVGLFPAGQHNEHHPVYIVPSLLTSFPIIARTRQHYKDIRSRGRDPRMPSNFKNLWDPTKLYKNTLL